MAFRRERSLLVTLIALITLTGGDSQVTSDTVASTEVDSVSPTSVSPTSVSPTSVSPTSVYSWTSSDVRGSDGPVSVPSPSSPSVAHTTQQPGANNSRPLQVTVQAKSPPFVVSINPERPSAPKIQASSSPVPTGTDILQPSSIPTATNVLQPSSVPTAADILQPSMTMDIYQSTLGPTMNLDSSDHTTSTGMTSYLPFPNNSTSSAAPLVTEYTPQSVSMNSPIHEEILPTSTADSMTSLYRAVPSISSTASVSTEQWITESVPDLNAVTTLPSETPLLYTESILPTISDLPMVSSSPVTSLPQENRTDVVIDSVSAVMSSETEVYHSTVMAGVPSVAATSPLSQVPSSILEEPSEVASSPASDIPVTVLATATMDVSMTTAKVTELPSAPKLETVRAQLTLSGNCSVLDNMKSADGMEEFKANLAKALSEELKFPTRQIKIRSISCGSIIVVVHFVNVTSDQNLKDLLQSMEEKDLFTTSNDTYSFSLLHYEPINDIPTNPTIPTKIKERKPLTQVQIIVIIVCSVVGGTLLAYAFGFCIYACYQKKKTKSFDLGETPGYNLNMDDFTLTKMQRPPPTYGVIVPGTQNGKAKKGSKKNGHYEAIEDEMQCLAPEDIHLASTLPRRTPPGDLTQTPVHSNGSATHGREEHCHHGSSGFDNPSFSSDDILDSGPDTDQELPLDTEPGSTAHSANNGYQNGDQALNSYRPDQIKGEGATAF